MIVSYPPFIKDLRWIPRSLLRGYLLGHRHEVPERDGIRIDLPLSQQDLADMIRASRQAVNRELRKLADHGLIHVERCRITILDEQGLRNLK